MPMIEPIRFTLLGPVRARRGGTDLDLGSPQQRTVLAALLLRGGAPVLLAELVDAVWGDQPPRAAGGTARTYIYRLRQTLNGSSGACIASVGGGYALATGPGEGAAYLDVTDFEQRVTKARERHRAGDLPGAAEHYRSALSLWDGPALGGLIGRYAEAQRTRLGELRLAAAEERLAIGLDLGHLAEARAELSGLVAEDPLRERPRELLMLALYRSGRPADALAAYDRGRRVLAEELGIDPGPRLRAMQRRILSADPKLLKAEVEAPAASRPYPKPAQLPADPPAFVGRGAELIEATELLSKVDTVPVLAVVGMGGVGKTAFAVRLAHALRDRYPDGQFYASGTGRSPADLLAAFLRACGIADGDLPSGVDERAALWRSATAGRRVLVLLDDAAGADQVTPLIPAAAGSAVLVTGQRRMADLPGARWLRLAGLDRDECLELLLGVLGEDRLSAEPVAARRLIAACAQHPLALRVAATRLAARPGWSVAALDERVRADQCADEPGCAAVYEPIAAGYRRLEPAQARALRLASLVPAHELRVPDAAALFDLPERGSEALLEALVDAHLVESGPGDGYRLHDLVRRFARREARRVEGARECEAALLRLLPRRGEAPLGNWPELAAAAAT